MEEIENKTAELFDSEVKTNKRNIEIETPMCIQFLKGARKGVIAFVLSKEDANGGYNVYYYKIKGSKTIKVFEFAKYRECKEVGRLKIPVHILNY